MNLNVLVCLLALGPAELFAGSNPNQPAGSVPSSSPRVAESYGKLPLYFEPNLGQAPPGVRYLTRTPGATILLKDTEAVIRLQRVEADSRMAPAAKLAMPGEAEGAVVRMRLAGARPPRQVEPLEKLPGVSNYFLGRDPKNWRKDIPQYQRVRYEEVYRGISVVYYGNGPQLQYDFTVEPGAEPASIELQFEGTERPRIEKSGDLLLETAAGDLRLAKPVAYQEEEGRRRAVEASYSLLADGRVGFALGEYDRSRPLVIDPTLVYSTYLGGATGITTAAVWLWMRRGTPTSPATPPRTTFRR